MALLLLVFATELLLNILFTYSQIRAGSILLVVLRGRSLENTTVIIVTAAFVPCLLLLLLSRGTAHLVLLLQVIEVYCGYGWTAASLLLGLLLLSPVEDAV